MVSLAERCETIWSSVRRSPTYVPTWLMIPHDHVDKGEIQGTSFQPNEHYFQVRINEMYLTYSREWIAKYDPMVFVVSEFIYGEGIETVPFVVGPMMLKKTVKEVPTGMIFSDTRVAGLHPYRGGRLCLSIVLCKVQRQNYVQKLLQVVENIANVLDFSHALTHYVKIASAVLDGVEALFGLGDTIPLLGIRKEFDLDAGDKLEPNYFVLIDLPASKFDPNNIWVRNHQLMYGRTLEEAKPFREADFVLYSLVQTSRRTDERLLPFYPLYEQVKQEATKTDKASWLSTKANMLTLTLMMENSPDLVLGQAQELAQKYRADMKRMHDDAVDMSRLSARVKESLSEKDERLRQAANILDL